MISLKACAKLGCLIVIALGLISIIIIIEVIYNNTFDTLEEYEKCQEYLCGPFDTGTFNCDTYDCAIFLEYDVDPYKTELCIPPKSLCLDTKDTEGYIDEGCDGDPYFISHNTTNSLNQDGYLRGKVINLPKTHKMKKCKRYQNIDYEDISGF